MPYEGYFAHTGMISQRHPFHGDETGEAAQIYSESEMFGPNNTALDRYDFYPGDIDKRYVGVQGYGGVSEYLQKGQPIIKGLLTGAITWLTARAVGIKPKNAARLGIVMGGMEAAVQLLGGWVRGEMAQVAQAAQAAEPQNELAPGTQTVATLPQQ